MSENKNKEAEILKKEIAYLSGLISRAKSKSNFQQCKQYDRKVSNTGNTSRPSTYQHLTTGSQYRQQKHFYQQNNFLPFPKSSKYIASSVKSKPTPYEIVLNQQTDATSERILSKSASCPVLLNSKSVKLKHSKVCSSQDKHSQSVQDNVLPQSIFGTSSSNFDNGTNSQKKNHPRLEEVRRVKVHVNPKFLKNISLPSTSSTSSTSTSNVPLEVKLSETMTVPKSSNSERSKPTIVSKSSNSEASKPTIVSKSSNSEASKTTIVSKSNNSEASKPTNVPRTSKQSLSSSEQCKKNFESQIQALRKNIGYEIPPLTNSSASRNTLFQKSTMNDSVLQSNQPNIQKQIMNLRKTLGYEIPSIPHKHNTEEQIRQLRASLGYELSNENNNKRERNLVSKSQSDPYHYSPKSSPVKTCSPYKLNKTRKSKDICAKIKLSFTSDQYRNLDSKSKRSKYVINRKRTPRKLSPKIIKSKFKFIVKSQAHDMHDTPSKMTGFSTSQKVAKTIISKYKIRKITDTGINKSKFLHNNNTIKNSWSVKDKNLPKFSPAYKWSSKSKNNLKGNVFSWRRLSHSSVNIHRRQFSSNHFNTRTFHHKNMLKPNLSYKTDTRSRSSHLVFINGFLYKTTGNSLMKTGSKKVDNRKNRSSTSSWNRKKPIIIKKVNGKETKTVQVRGVTFEMASNGHSLKRIDTSTSERKSSEKKNKVTRIDLHGITYIQTKPGTLVKMDTLRTRAVTSRAINKSINTIITNKQRKKVNKQYCIYYNRFGKCNRGTSCPFLHDPEKIAVCTRFLRGTCKVKDCLFSHQVSEDKMPVCSYFLKGRCDKDDCPYLHVKVSQNAAICLSFINGYCPNGKECKKLHTRICPEFSKTGKCMSGKRCQLEHKRRKITKRKNSNLSQEASSITTKEHNLTVEDSTTNTTKLPSYISLVEYSSPYIPSNTNQRYSQIPVDQDESLHIKPRL